MGLLKKAERDIKTARQSLAQHSLNDETRRLQAANKRIQAEMADQKNAK